MYNETQDRLKRVKGRVKSKRKLGLHIFFVFLIVFLYFIFSSNNNVLVDEKTGAITIVEKPKIIKEDFSTVYSGKVGNGDTLDFDIDLTDVYLTGAIVDIEFSNNKNFTLLPIGSDENIDKVRFGYMLGKSRNKDQVFWVGRVVESVIKKRHEVIEDQEDGRLYFRAANLDGGDLYIKITLSGEKIIKKD